MNVYGATFTKNTSEEVAYAAIYADQRSVTTISGNTVNGVIKKTLFEENGAGAFYGNVIGSLSVSDTIFRNNTGAAIRLANKGETASILTLKNVEFDNNSAAVSVAHANVTITDCTFTTANDKIYIDDANGSVTFAGTITIHADAQIYGIGTYIISKDTTFTSVRDFSDIAIAVDGSVYNGEAVKIASGVSCIGKYTMLNGNNELALTTNADNELILDRIQEVALDNEDIVGTGSGLLVGGSATNYISAKTTAADTLVTTVKGGEVSGNIVGGAYAKATDEGFTGANIGFVNVNFSDGANVAARVYSGGYFYGNGTFTTTVQMLVDNVAVNMDGGEVSGNVYGGIHARQGGNARVTEVNISVTNGAHGRIYGGGWAEGGARSAVGTANIVISGGTVDYIYGGGANGSGTTVVTNCNITIGGDAEVGTIFMSGRYGQSTIGGTTQLVFEGEEKVISRLSGVSSSGRDNAANTVVEVRTALIADVIDFVDKFIINENCSITANNEFTLGNRDYESGDVVTDSSTLFDIITDGVESDWTAIAGITDFTNAKFAINGKNISSWGEADILAIGDYTLQRTEDNGKYAIKLLKA